MNRDFMELLAEKYDGFKVATMLGYLSLEAEPKVSLFKDQDGNHHLIVESKYLNKEQLAELYTSIFGNGAMNTNRAKAYEQALKGFPTGTSFITIASLFQSHMFGPTDMRLMSVVTAWMDGVYDSIE